MNPALQSFETVALPIVIAITLVAWTNNGRITDLRNDMNQRFDEVIKRLDRIELKLEGHEERLVRLEERTSPIHR